jgi:hypothetical protein
VPNFSEWRSDWRAPGFSEVSNAGPRVIHLPERREKMIVAIVLVLLILALAGGIAVNPLLFLIALLAVVVFLGNGRRGTAL